VYKNMTPHIVVFMVPKRLDFVIDEFDSQHCDQSYSQVTSPDWRSSLTADSIGFLPSSKRDELNKRSVDRQVLICIEGIFTNE
jgi:hypothetical protein